MCKHIITVSGENVKAGHSLIITSIRHIRFNTEQPPYPDIIFMTNHDLPLAFRREKRYNDINKFRRYDHDPYNHRNL